MRNLSCRLLFASPAMLLVVLLAGCNSTPGGQQNAVPVIANGPAAANTPATSAPDPVAPPPAASTLAHYSDAATGVSFDYPDIWQKTISAPGYFGGELPGTYGTPKLAVSFSPEGNLYARTVLTGLTFVYSAKSAKSAPACASGLQGNMTPANPVTINGTTYQEFAGGDAGMCHQQSSTIDVTYDPTHARCLAFERDFNTECFGAGDNKRKLTAEETHALQRHLDDVMQSVVVHF